MLASRLGTVLIVVFGIIVLSHFLFLNSFPAGVNHDEAEVLLSARNYFSHAADISGVVFPLSLFSTKTEAGLSGLPSVLISPFIGPFPGNVTLFRIPFVMLNLATAITLGLLVYRLSSNRRLSLITGAIFLINPWSFAYSRAATEAPFGLFFILLALLLMFNAARWRIFYSLASFILAFLSYFGAKPVILCLVPLSLVLHYFFVPKSSRRLKYYLSYLLVFAGIVVLYFAASFMIPGSTFSNRSPEINVSHLERYAPLVDHARTQTITNPFSQIFLNKYTLLLGELAHKYSGWLDPDFLFFAGDPRSTYRFGASGVIYLVDFIFILLGIASLKSPPKTFIGFICFLFILGPIGAALSLVDTSYFFRAFLLLPGLVILIAVGIEFIFKQLPRRYVTVFVVTLILVYGISFLGFLHFFFFQYSISQQENQFFSERLLSNYLKRTNYSPSLLVVSPLKISYQSQIFDQSAMPLRFAADCSDLKSLTTPYIIAAAIDCPELTGPFLSIQDQKDAGTIYHIYHDTLCTGIELSPYRRFKLIPDYNVEQLTDTQFCQKWINR